jgi:hypothetical protein
MNLLSYIGGQMNRHEIKASTRNMSLIISYLGMRRIIGFLGIGLPVIVVLGGYIQNGVVIQGSISGYYYTNMRDFYVGLLFSVSLFLLSYKGYERIDDIVGNMSGIFAMGAVIFPTSMFSGKVVKVGIFLIDDNISEYLHLIFAALFFLSLAFNSLFLFTRHEGFMLSREKKKRNVVYIICGLVMLISMLCTTAYTLLLRDTVLSKMNPVLVLETISLFSFGISWLVKGNTLFRDKNRVEVQPKKRPLFKSVLPIRPVHRAMQQK